MAERYVRMNILSSGGEKAKATLDDLTARARALGAESPELKISADDTPAQKKIKDLQLKLAILDREHHQIFLDVKDDAAKAKYLDWKTKLDKLNAEVIDPKFKLDDADKVEAQLIKIKLLMDSFHNKTIDLKVKSDTSKLAATESILSRLARSSNKSILGIPKPTNGGNGGGGENELAGLLNGSPGAFLTNPLVAGPLGSLLAALLPSVAGFGVGGLVGGAGIAGGFFGASQGTTQLKADTTTITQLEAALKSKSTPKNQIAGDKSALTAANKQFSKDSAFYQPFLEFQKSIKDLGQNLLAPLRSIMGPLQGIFAQFGKWLKDIGPELTQMFKASLPFIKSFMMVMESAGKSLIPAFTQAMNTMVKSGALSEMTQALVLLIKAGLVPMLKAMGPGMKASATVFKAVVILLSGVLVGLGGAATFIARELALLGHAVTDVGKVFYSVGRIIAALLGGNWTAMGNAVRALGNNFRNFFATLANMLDAGFVKISHFGHDVAGVFDGIRHDVASIWDKTWSEVGHAFQTFYNMDAHMMANFRHSIANVFDGLRHDVANIWDMMWHDLESKASSVFDTIKSNVRSNWDAITNAFRHGVADVRSIFDMLKSDLSTPWNWIVSHVFHPIENVWNDIAKVVHLPKIGGFASGGRINSGTTGTADDVLIRASKGETVVSAAHSQALAPIFSAVGIPGYAAGGIIPGGGVLGNIIHGAEGVGSNLINIGKDVADIIANPAKIFQALENTTREGIFSPIVTSAIKGIVNAFKSTVENAFSSKFMGHYGAGVAQWRPDVLKALGMEHLSASLASRVLFQMQTESGGNPNAINLTDSNAAAGDPSRGLLQTIMSTFRAYHWPGTSWNIYNPLANIAAAINYARHRYGPNLMSGGMGMGSGHGYANGGWLTEPIIGQGLRSGQAYSFGEMGPEFVSPANRMRGGAGGGDTYNIYVLDDDYTDAKAIRQIQTIRRYKKRHGNLNTGIG